MDSGSGVVIAAVITATFSGIIGIITALPTVVRTIREIRRGDTLDYQDAVNLRGIIRRAYTWLNGRPAWEEMPEQLRKDIEEEAKK